MTRQRASAMVVALVLVLGVAAWSSAQSMRDILKIHEVAGPQGGDGGQAAPGTGSGEITGSGSEVKRDAGAQTYTVQPGDSLWKIAEQFFGDGNRYWDLVDANKEKYPSIAKNPNLIHIGWVLTIPAGGRRAPGGTPATPGTSGNTPAPKVPAPPAGASGGKALLGWLQAAGLSGDKLRTAWAVGMAESGGNPRAHNPNRSTGDNSYGLYQINMIDSLGPARRRQYGLRSNEDLFDPATNIRVMLQMSNNCTNWQPWSAYKNGSYRRYYNQFPPR